MTSYQGKSGRLGKSNLMQSVNLLLSKFWHSRKLVYFLTWYTRDRCSRSPALQENLSEVHFQLVNLLSQEFQKARGKHLLLGWPASEDQWGMWPGSWTCCFAELNYLPHSGHDPGSVMLLFLPWESEVYFPRLWIWSGLATCFDQKKVVEVVSPWGLGWKLLFECEMLPIGTQMKHLVSSWWRCWGGGDSLEEVGHWEQATSCSLSALSLQMQHGQPGSCHTALPTCCHDRLRPSGPVSQNNSFFK